MALGPPRRDGKRYRSRLDEVLLVIKQRAHFWEKLSHSVFLGGLALVGLVILQQGLSMLTTGTQDLSILRRLSNEGTWSFVFMAWGLVGFGCNLMAPIALYWTVTDRTAVITTLIFFATNSLVFFYGYFLGYITVL